MSKVQSSKSKPKVAIDGRKRFAALPLSVRKGYAFPDPSSICLEAAPPFEA
ncbi:MAG: hypothetical protein ACR2HX_18645 [Pyrinomonadaceae bacterium]